MRTIEPEIIPPGVPIPATVPEVVTGTLILRGHGYEAIASITATEQKRVIVEAARKVVAVTDSDSCDIAQARIKALAALRTSVEKSRTDVKAPVLELGRRIDGIAKEFVAEVVTEEARLSALVADYAREQQRIKREAEMAAERERQRIERERHEAEMAAQREQQRIERERMEAERQAHEAAMAKLRAEAANSAEAQAEARRQQEAALAAQRDAEARAEAARVKAAQDAEAARQRQAEAERAAAAAAAAPVIPAGVKEEIDFEVTDAAALYAKFPQFCRIEVLRAPLLEAINKSFRAKGALPNVPGIRVFQNLKVKGRR